jgi:uncharacterized protein (DUF779 family)
VTVCVAWAIRHLGTFAMTLGIVGGQMLAVDAITGPGVPWPTAAAVGTLATLLVVRSPQAPATPQPRRFPQRDLPWRHRCRCAVRAGGSQGGDMAGTDQARVAITPVAERVLGELVAKFGDVLLVQAGGCCDGSAPVCLSADEFDTSDQDVHVADLAVPGGVVPFWQSEHQYAYSRHLFLTVDAEPGFGAEFSLETSLDMRLLIHQRMASDEEDGSSDEPPVLTPQPLPGSVL